MVTPQSIQHHSEPQKTEFLQQGELWEPCAAVSKDTGVYFRSARLPGHGELGSECCFEVACEPPAVYTALWESFPGLLSWPELSWREMLGHSQHCPQWHTAIWQALSHFISLLTPSVFTFALQSPLLIFQLRKLNKQQQKNLSSRCLVQIQLSNWKLHQPDNCSHLIWAQSENADGDSRSKKGSRGCSGQAGAVSDVDQTELLHSILYLQPAQLKVQNIHPLHAQNSHPLSNTLSSKPDFTRINTGSGKISEPTQAPNFPWLLKR